jgi:hypothetical protein
MTHLDGPGDTWIDDDGCLNERTLVGGQEVIVRYDDIPESDITTLNGLRITTALRTVIDIAAQLDASEFEEVVANALTRGLFTPSEAIARCSEPDLRARAGAIRLTQYLSEHDA